MQRQKLKFLRIEIFLLILALSCETKKEEFVRHYYDNGKILEEGNLLDNKKVGNWKFYTKDDYLKNVRVYKLDERGNSFLCKNIFYLQSGKKIYSEVLEKDNWKVFIHDTLNYLTESFGISPVYLDKPEIKKGATLFIGNCYQCHSLDYSEKLGPPLVEKIKNYEGEDFFRFLHLEEKIIKNDSVIKYENEGLKGIKHPQFKDLKESEIKSIYKFINTINPDVI